MTEASAQVSKSGFSTHKQTDTHKHTAGYSGQQPGELCSRAELWLAERTEMNRTSQPCFLCVCVFCVACSPQRCMCSQCVHCDPASQPDLSGVWRPTALYKIGLQLLSIKMCLLFKKHNLQLCHCPCLLSFLFVLQQFLMVTRETWAPIMES